MFVNKQRLYEATSYCHRNPHRWHIRLAPQPERWVSALRRRRSLPRLLELQLLSAVHEAGVDVSRV
jgi:hypothetical protein